MNEWVRKEVCCGVETSFNGFQVMVMAGEGTQRDGNSFPNLFPPWTHCFPTSGFHYDAQAGLELGIFLPQPPWCWDYTSTEEWEPLPVFLSSFIFVSVPQMSDTVEFVCTLGSSGTLPLTTQLLAFVSPLQGVSSDLISGHSTRRLFQLFEHLTLPPIHVGSREVASSTFRK